MSLTTAIYETRQKFYDNILDMLQNTTLTNQQIAEALGTSRCTVVMVSKLHNVKRKKGRPRKVTTNG